MSPEALTKRFGTTLQGPVFDLRDPNIMKGSSLK